MFPKRLALIVGLLTLTSAAPVLGAEVEITWPSNLGQIDGSDTDTEVLLNIERCFELLEDDADLTFTFDFDDVLVPSGGQYEIEVTPEGTSSCQTSAIEVDDDECEDLAGPSAIPDGDVTLTFSASEILGFSDPRQCLTSGADRAVKIYAVFDETTTLGEDSIANTVFTLQLDLRRPAPLSAPPEIVPGENEFRVSWEAVDAETDKEVDYGIFWSSGTLDVGALPEEIDGSGGVRFQKSLTSSARISVSLGNTYEVAVVTVNNETGNRSLLSPVAVATAVETVDFWELYDGYGGRETGCATAAGARLPGALGLGLLAGLALAATRRRRPLPLWLLAAVGAGSVSLAAPAYAELDGDDVQSPITGFLELKLGGYYPSIDSEFDGVAPYAEVFGEERRLYGELEYEYEFWRGVGSLGLGVNIGLMRDSGNAVLEDAEETAGDETSFRMIPLRLAAIYRFDYLQTRYGVPLAFAVKAGLDYYFWRVTDGEGTAVDAEGNKGRGGTAGFHVAFGAYFLLDFLAPGMARSFDVNAGVNNSYLFAEYMIARIDDFGSSSSWDLSDELFLFGLGFEF